eukprot:COSAG01_NODE_31_length_35900_cov_44.332169_17_plen_103_part_00
MPQRRTYICKPIKRSNHNTLVSYMSSLVNVVDGSMLLYSQYRCAPRWPERVEHSSHESNSRAGTNVLSCSQLNSNMGTHMSKSAHSVTCVHKRRAVIYLNFW